MCGIGGMLGSPDNRILNSIIDLLDHRGPDGRGTWLDDQCGLSHARLSILDLDGSPQPILSDHNSVLVANGEIYNHLELKVDSYPYRTGGDSESILALHRRHAGSSAVGHASWISQLNGMFAFAIWDEKNKQLILARDTMGIKPLVRTMIGPTLLFASEAKALRAHESYTPRIDDLALRARLAWEYPLDATSLFMDVYQVRPGTVETWSLDDGKAVMTGCASFARQMVEPTSDWSQPEHLLETFISDVEDRLMADVPVGIVLSGGLDSSLVAAVAREASNRSSNPLPACWTVAESEDNPDWQAAELVASSLDLVHHQHLLDPDAFHKSLPALSWHGADLDVSVLFFQPLFAKMSEKVTVGLCGQGADELHAGYPRYRDLQAHAKTIEHRLALSNTDLSSLEGEQWWGGNHSPGNHCSSLEKFLQFELDHGQLSNFQLRLVDRHSMAHSLEVRVPFLGRAHRQASSKLPMDWRLGPDMEEKAALRRAADLTELPSEIVRRPKLPAGTATAPTMLKQLMSELAPRAKVIAEQSGVLKKVLLDQPDMAIGFGLFKAMHILDGGRSAKSGDISSLLDEVIQ